VRADFPRGVHPSCVQLRSARPPDLACHRASLWQEVTRVSPSQSPQSHDRSRGLRALWAIRSHPWHPLDLAGLQEAWRGWATKQGVCSRGSPAIQAGQGYSGTDPITQAARTWRVLDRQVLTILNDRNSAPAYFSRGSHSTRETGAL
jgi:hypothetical protein